MNTIQKTGCLFLLLLAGISGHTQKAPSSSLLWQISGNGLTQPSYLFGTFHIMCREDFLLSDILKQKLAGTKQFYGELKMDDPNLSMQMASRMAMPGKTLQSMMTADDYKKANARFQEITGMSMQLLDHFKPFMALSLITVNSLRCPDKVQPETEFVQLAKDNHLPVLGLETVDDEMNAIDKEPLDSQVSSLKKMLLNFDSARTELQDMLVIYKKRDIDSIYAFIKKQNSDDAFEQALLVTRNNSWVPVMQKAMAAMPSFFAVGAGHLGGSEGVISLLRKRGYTLTPITY